MRKVVGIEADTQANVKPPVAFFGSEKRVWMHDSAGHALSAAFVMSGVVGLLLSNQEQLIEASEFLFTAAVFSSAIAIFCGAARFVVVRDLFSDLSEPGGSRLRTQRVLYWVNSGIMASTGSGMLSFAVAMVIFVFSLY
jgi:hypothetical protein